MHRKSILAIFLLNFTFSTIFFVNNGHRAIKVHVNRSNIAEMVIYLHCISKFEALCKFITLVSVTRLSKGSLQIHKIHDVRGVLLPELCIEIVRRT